MRLRQSRREKEGGWGAGWEGEEGPHLGLRGAAGGASSPAGSHEVASLWGQLLLEVEQWPSPLLPYPLPPHPLAAQGWTETEKLGTGDPTGAWGRGSWGAGRGWGAGWAGRDARSKCNDFSVWLAKQGHS